MASLRVALGVLAVATLPVWGPLWLLRCVRDAASAVLHNKLFWIIAGILLGASSLSMAASSWAIAFGGESVSRGWLVSAIVNTVPWALLLACMVAVRAWLVVQWAYQSGADLLSPKVSATADDRDDASECERGERGEDGEHGDPGGERGERDPGGEQHRFTSG